MQLLPYGMQDLLRMTLPDSATNLDTARQKNNRSGALIDHTRASSDASRPC
jgi:hypothetical protein